MTIAHEIIHWYLHQKYFKLLALLDDETYMMSCEVEPKRYSEGMTVAQKAHWYAEWQANALALRVAMPQELMKQALYEARDAAAPHHFTGELVEDMLRRVADLLDVPIFAAKQRARQIGFSGTDGAFVYVDGKWHEPFWFTECAIAPSETYVIDRKGCERLYANHPDFAELIDSGRFIYIDYVTCINGGLCPPAVPFSLAVPALRPN